MNGKHCSNESYKINDSATPQFCFEGVGGSHIMSRDKSSVPRGLDKRVGTVVVLSDNELLICLSRSIWRLHDKIV